MPACRYCNKYFHRLGIMRHEAMHRDDERDDQSWRCKADVEVPEQYRVSRGHGFRMHYETRQCKNSRSYGDYCHMHKHLNKGV